MKKIFLILLFTFSFSSSVYAACWGSKPYWYDRPVGNCAYGESKRWNDSKNVLQCLSRSVFEVACSPTISDDDLCRGEALQFFEGVFYTCNAGNFTPIESLENGYFDDQGNMGCNDNFSLTGVGNGIPACMPNPPNGTYDDNDDLVCNQGYFNDNGSCSPTNDGNNTDPNANPDGSCKDGYSPTLNGCQTVSTGGDSGSGSTGGDSGSGSTGGDSGSGSTGGDSGSGSTGGDSGSGSTGGDSGSGSTGGDSGSGTTGGGSGSGSTGGDSGSGSTGGDSGSGTTGGGSGSGSTGGTGGDTENVDNVSTAAYTCNDGGKSITTSSGLQSCDRTCEEVGLITDSDSNCKTSSTCPEGQYQAGINYLTNTPICYDLTATDTNNKLLAKIVDNTSLNKNSNTQLGSINTNINKSNVYLKNIDTNLSNINDDTFKDNTTSTSLKTEAESNKSLLTDIQTAYTNVTTAFSTLQTNYNDLKSFIDGKKLENNTINISSITLAKNNITVFGKTQRMDCFFNQDLNALFAPISPFITFFLNISFVYLSIKLFMNYALANRGGIV
jgi:hypothetical protein